jgi:hypothetical protein
MLPAPGQANPGRGLLPAAGFTDGGGALGSSRWWRETDTATIQIFSEHFFSGKRYIVALKSEGTDNHPDEKYIYMVIF